MNIAKYATNRRFLRYVVLPNVLFTIVAYFTPTEPLIVILNLVLISLSVAVCVAFVGDVVQFVFNDVAVDKSYLLVVGVFVTWFASTLRTGLSIVWRWLGEPTWITNTGFTTYFLYLMTIGAILHCLSPGAINETIPPRRWVKIGLLVGLGVFVALVLLYASDIQARWIGVLRGSAT